MNPNITINIDPSCDGCICWKRDKPIVCDDNKSIRIAKNRAEAKAHRGTTERAVSLVAMQNLSPEKDREKELELICKKLKIDLTKDTITIKKLQLILKESQA